MANKKTDEAPKKETLHERAMRRYKALNDYWAQNRKLALEDIEFRAGDQWPEKIKSKRTKQNRPALTFHKQEAYIRQVVNDGRQNRPSIKYRPVDNGSDAKVADAYQGLARQILAKSNADEAFDTALDHACGNGFGYIRLVTDYIHDKGFEQEAMVKRVRNPLAVLLAPHQSADGSDAEDGFVIDQISKGEYKRKWPKAKADDWKGDFEEGWVDDDSVRVCEYFYKEGFDTALHLLDDGTSVTQEELDDAIKNGIQLPRVVKTRPIKDIRVKWCRLSGAEVLEEGEFPSRYIPIIPVYGEEIDVNGKVTYRGLVRPARDALQLYNYERTAYCERVALAPKAPFVGAVGQFEGRDEWETANDENHPYLAYNPIDVNGNPVPPPQRQPAGDVPAGLVNGIQITEHDIQAAMGLFSASLGDKSNEKSGRAILARQKEGDVGSFHYHDNLNRAVRHLGRILLEVIPKIYDTKRVVRILGEDGDDEEVMLNPSMETPTAMVEGMRVFNLNVGRYDVDVSAGPSYTTRRQESADAMMEIASRNPTVWQTHGDLIVQSQDWPNADEFAERTKALMPPDMKAAIEQEKQQGKEEGPDPAVQAIMAQAEQALQQRDQMLQQALEKLKELQAQADAKDKELAIKEQELQIKSYDAETKRLQVTAVAMQPEQIQAIVDQTVQQAMTPRDLDMQSVMQSHSDAMGQLAQAVMSHGEGIAKAVSAPKRRVLERDPMTGEAIGVTEMPMEQQQDPMGEAEQPGVL